MTVYALSTQPLSGMRYQGAKPPQKPSPRFEYYQANQATVPLESADNLRQWPWRLFAFASDLGTLAHLLKRPRLAGLGWLIAAPYYGVAIIRHGDPGKRNEELAYQLTANGIFPVIEAKLGTNVGALAQRNLMKLTRYPLAQWASRLPRTVWCGVGGVVGMALLTPLVGDPMSHGLVSLYKQVTQGVAQ